ncbi:sigma-70 family RNA polymerase sigma factor [Planomonospora parontospora]|uniref:sigma-70 family RNA polymerase sigma factor n=1 Tax=Planomonospora parontospora TaxID=58119 RepID=UPI0019414A61|nr:sigma-70 family RNA polymerase sigma factor [Planomonospora parontospora]GGL18118.1 DNA-directed RNA polymerase sigma-70 factor [Planomonospora parontospora subsp. antibiotica]GII15595.1 DNA-directed RNA polymerase sigma-70 factor [Planomonospora parontospora subsp. antibiotica]
MVETSTGEGSRLEPFRTELTGYCYRMLGSGFEAEDAVQETLLRAWRSFDRYDERRASLRTWLYRIATNVCLDMLRSAQRRALAMDLSRAADAGTGIGAPLPERVWIQPVPDGLVLPADDGPEEAAVRRETIRLAFVAALQHLPPRQRAVLILRDVLCWKAEEVARLLETTTASVTSALQRARATLRAVGVPPGEPFRPSDPAQRELLARYCTAFERHDVAGLVALLHEDATMSMPPFTWWLRGRDRIRQALLSPAASCEGASLVPVEANGSPAFWQLRPGPDGSRTPFGLVLLDVSGGLIGGITVYLDAERLIRLLGSPVVSTGVPRGAAGGPRSRP